MVRCIAVLFIVAVPGWALDSVREVHSARPFAAYTAMPVMDRGYLFFITGNSPELDVYTPTGQLAFATTIQGPDGAAPSLFESAIDDHGTVAVAIAYKDAGRKTNGAILLLDGTGKQAGLISTGRYMPSHLCFDPDGQIWTTGWQRDAEKTEHEDRQDYSIVRRFDASTKQQTGAFVPRSSFPRGLSPGGAWGGQWMIRAAGERVGMLLMSGQTSEKLVWLELDSSGAETGRWTLPSTHTDGVAFSPRGLYAVTRTLNEEQRSTVWALNQLDKTTSAWKPVAKAEYSWDQKTDYGNQLGADGDQLVLEKDMGATLEWVKP
jgi:hypothetical protein